MLIISAKVAEIMALFIHQRAEWPQFRWDIVTLAAPLADVRHRQGRLIGRMEAMGLALRQEANFGALTEEIIQTSAIEGERLSRDQVRSSLARRLGVDIGALAPVDRHVDGVVEMMLDATQNYAAPLTSERLCSWQAALFPTGRSGLSRVTVGAWRSFESGPMQVVSGPLGRQKVHFEAPDAGRLPSEMEAFLDWFDGEGALDLVLRAGLAHLWFVTIHPFDDGNGRVARAIGDMALARSECSARRFYSLSSQIGSERKDYYDILERTQRGDLDITSWLLWFLGCLGRAVENAEILLKAVLAKAQFWEAHRNADLNARQRAVLLRMLDGWEGKMTSSKYAKIAKCSQDTAGRDIESLCRQGVLARSVGGGRSTSYELVEVDG